MAFYVLCYLGLVLVILTFCYCLNRGNRLKPVLCAWCLKKGVLTQVGWSEVDNSHGICPDCRAEVFMELQRFEEGRRQ